MACWPLVTDLADPGHPGVDVPPLPLPGFHGCLTEEDVDLVIMRVVGIRDGVGTDECRLCRRKEQHNMSLCPDLTLWYCPWEQCEMLRVQREPHGRAPFLMLRLQSACWSLSPG